MEIVASEKDIVKGILDYLKLRNYLCKRNNAGMAFMRNGNKSRGIKIGEAGWPDIEGITKKGVYFGIEVKTNKGKLSPSQIEIGQKITESNGIWFVARSIDDVIKKGF